jgi:NAD(P)-dependent dehydrogenase (short-subunit alcohol dehydrogenase family)
LLREKSQMSSLQNHVALAPAPTATAAGADIAVNFRAQAGAAESVCQTIRDARRKCIAVQADVSINADVERLVKTVETELGPVAILANNAGRYLLIASAGLLFFYGVSIGKLP